MSNFNFSDREISEFKIEAEELLEQAENNLLDLENGGEFTANYDSIFRAFHSIKGASGMLGMELLQSHMHLVENHFQGLKETAKISKEQIGYFLRSVDHARALLANKIEEFNLDFNNITKSQITDSANKPIAEINKKNKSEAPLRVMVIDDEEYLVDILKETLEHVGFEVFGFTKPEEAVSSLSVLKPDVVCTDMKMPGLSGFDVLNKIQNYDEDIPVIFISGHMDKEMLIESMSLGVHAVIEKPFKDTVVFNTAFSAAKRFKTLKLLTKTINLLIANMNEIVEHLLVTGKEDEAKLLKAEYSQLIQSRRDLRTSKINSIT